MGALSVVQAALPARVQDVARQGRDLLSPTRRRGGEQQTDDLSAAVSPDGRVLAGPFEGLRLAPETTWGGRAARLAGAYEEEITAALLELCQPTPSRVIDVGSAEGYYAVGLARMLPQVSVVAFDIDPLAMRACRRNAALNDVHNLHVRGRATPARLQRAIRPGSLVLCDCEGYEAVLMDPVAAPALATCRLLVELHEFAVPGVTEQVVARFRQTHSVHLVDAVPRTTTGRAQLRHLDEQQEQGAVQEGRPALPPMQWAVMRPRSS